jgi:hypothetical protein
MKSTVWFCAIAVCIFLTSPRTVAQEPPKPGPEHDILKKHVGTWDLVMSFDGMETKGTVVAKMELGGLWLVSSLECDLFGNKFYGKGLDTYDAATKKYVSVWVDSMGTRPLTLEGTYDPATGALTLTGEGPGMDGKPTTFRSVTKIPDENTINFSMYMGDRKEPAFTIVYKRRK